MFIFLLKIIMKTKLTPKQKQEKKEFIKKQIFKIIHVIGYVCIFLVALFSILMSVQSCNKKPNNRNASNVLDHNTQLRVNDYSTNNQYSLYYDIVNNNGVDGLRNSQFAFNLQFFKDEVLHNEIFTSYSKKLRFTFNIGNDNLDMFYGYDKASYSYIFARGGIELEFESETNLTINAFNKGYTGVTRLAYYDFSNPSLNVSQFDNLIFKFAPQDSTNYFIFEGLDHYDNTVYSKSYMFDNTSRVLRSQTWIDLNIEYYFSNLFPLQTESFRFVDNFNPVSLYSQNLNGAINLTSLTIQQYNSNFSYICKTDRAFICNGEVFDTMRVVGLDLTDNATYYTLDGENFKIWNLGGSYFVPFYLAYENSVSGLSHGVLYLNSVIRDSNNGTALYFNSYRWSNEIYKNITILDKDYKINSNFYTQTDIDMMSVLNNGNNNNIGNIVSGYSTSLGSSNNNVFVWLRGAFSSLTDIFSIALLPGVSIGILIFLPMVVTIIIVIFKLIKK